MGPPEVSPFVAEAGPQGKRNRLVDLGEAAGNIAAWQAGPTVGAVRMIGGLQMLRGVAATLVVLFHLQAASVYEAGVDVFFVLSGFVIFHSVQGRADRGAGWFLRQRFWRIVPSYWAALGLTLLAMAGLAVMQGDWSGWPGLTTLVISVLLLPLPDQVMAIAWTLTVEGMFYLLFAATYFRWGTKGALWALAAWALVTIVLKYLHLGLPPVFGLILYSGATEFLFGALISLAIGKGWRAGAVPALVLGLIGLGLVVTETVTFAWGRVWVAGLPSAALVYGLAAGGWRMPGWALVWGEASYLLYLLHLLVFSVAGTLLRMAGVAPYGSVGVMLALGALSIVVSVAATVWFERPYRAWTKGR
jgi:exopolysaccharide production protein ExoZ